MEEDTWLQLLLFWIIKQLVELLCDEVVTFKKTNIFIIKRKK